MKDRSDMPRESEMTTVDCKCDYCGCSLDRKTKIWTWNEHFGCTKDHVQKAQGITNALASAVAFKHSLEKAIEKDTDLL